MPAYIPVAAIAFALSFYWQYASWDLLKTIELRHPHLDAELGRPRYAVIGTPFLMALTRLLVTDCAKHHDVLLYRRIIYMRGVAVILLAAFFMLSYLTSSPVAA